MYEEPAAKTHLFRTYQRVHTRMHGNRASLGAIPTATDENYGGGRRESRACFYATSQHAILVWLTSVRITWPGTTSSHHSRHFMCGG